MEPYKIPQNIGIEDKIVGPLTLRQLLIVAGGFGISYVLFAIISRIYEVNILEYIIIGIPLLLSIAIAMVKINDKSLIKFLLLFLELAIKPKQRVWDHRGIAALVMPDLTGGKAEVKAIEPKEDEITKKATKAKNLNELTRVLDSGGFDHVKSIEHDDLDDTHDDDLVTQAYFGHKENETENMYWRTKESHKKRLDLFAKLPITNIKKGSKEAEAMQKEILAAKKEVAEMKKEQAPKKAVEPKAEAPKRLTPTAIKQPAKPTAAEAPSQPVKDKPAKPATPPTQPKTETTDKPKRKRPRRRKRTASDPARADKQVNTTQAGQTTQPKPAEAKQSTKQAKPKNKPMNQTQTAPTTQPKTTEAKSKAPDGGEFKLEELKKGEIEINLD